MTRPIALLLCVLMTGCSPAREPTLTDSERAALRDTIAAQLDRLASAISRRDARAVAEDVLLDSGVVYVSDGRVIRGYEYVRVLAAFYGGLRSLEFRWRRKEVRILSRDGAVATGLADIASVDTTGQAAQDSAVFTNVFHRLAGRWQMVAVQKTTYRQ